MRRRFVTLDVFTARRFAGNPLAVMLDADALPTEAMQAIAREFNLSETVFVLAPLEPSHRARLRIFTPRRELPFAGHPTVGTAVLLRSIDGGTDERPIVLEEGIGPVRCVARTVAGGSGWARFDSPREPQHLEDIDDAADIAAALNLTLDDLGFDDFIPGNWSAGNPLTFVPVRGLDAIARSRPDPAVWDRTFGPDDPAGVFVFCRETADGHDFHARMFAPGLGVPEDPATGSAAAAFTGLLVRFERLADGSHEFAIEQGYEMGRPSLIQLTVTIRRGTLDGASIAGDAVIVTEGTLEA
jgi:trans-2,3-dihydro-3-hydroxyanthranilate isomerase